LACLFTRKHVRVNEKDLLASNAHVNPADASNSTAQDAAGSEAAEAAELKPRYLLRPAGHS
jgi:hypothetical protein